MRALLLGLLAACWFAPTCAAPVANKVVGYYIAWARDARNFSPEKIDASKLTHINYAFANIVDGKAVLGYPDVDAKNFEGLRALKKTNPKLKLLVSVGGWAWSKHFSDVALADASRTVFADSVVVYMQKYQLDGVDIDWEFPVGGGDPGNSARPEDKRNFTLLLQAVRKALDAAGKKAKQQYLLTIASNPGPDYLRNTELGEVAKAVDWINVMGYDYHGPWGKRAGPLAPLWADAKDDTQTATSGRFVAAGIEGHIKAGVPLNKIVLGVPFYGYVWKGCPDAMHGQYQTCAGAGKGTWEEGSLEYADIVANYLSQPGFTRYWNDATKTPWLYNPESGIYITYDDPESMGHKLDYVVKQKLGGVMIWELTTDRERALLAPIARKLLH